MKKNQFTTVWSAPQAFWGGHKTGPNRVSLTAPTHSSVEGMLRRVLGHRGIRWAVEEVRILELGNRLPITTRELTHYPAGVIASTNRTPRTWVYLTDVTILVTACLVSDNNEKYVPMFERRMQHGQVYDLLPTMGPKQCMVSDFRFAQPEDLTKTPLALYEDMGIQPYSQDFEDPAAPWYYAPLSIENGVVHYPSWKEVRTLGMRRGGAL